MVFASCLLLLLMLAGCSAPPTASGPGSSPLSPVGDSGQTVAPAGNSGKIVAPTGDIGRIVTGNPVQIDRSCRSDADCTVKDVGNCCGYYPACVNLDSPTDPAAVKAQCAKNGMASVCGFPAISSCQCVNNQCQGSNQARLK